jgi:hypothetical protein
MQRLAPEIALTVGMCGDAGEKTGGADQNDWSTHDQSLDEVTGAGAT